MNKVIILLFTLTFLISGCKNDDTVLPPETPTHPNILLVIADDLGIEATPNYPIGDIKPHMPTLESLASSGITFDNVWANPLCSPTRATILTGRYGYRTGVLNPESASIIPATEQSIHKYLDENTNQSYNHALIGKWHLSYNYNRLSQMGIGYYAGNLLGAISDYFEWALTENGNTEQFSGYATSKTTDLAIDWINSQDKPWFCWLAYNAAHTPFHLPPDHMHSQGSLPSDPATINANPMPYFLAMTESIDYEMGRLLNAIPPSVKDNTLVIFIGDNGSHKQVIQPPYTPSQSKGSLFQGGINVPMVISGKGVSRMGERDENLINSSDLFATIADVAGVNVNNYEDSQSFKPLLSSAAQGSRDYCYAEYWSDGSDVSGYAVRNDQYKLIQYDSGTQLFFDLMNDPFEQQNLLSGSLTSVQNENLQVLINKAEEIRQ